MIKVIYLISIILLFIFAILVKKKEEKIDFITTFVIQTIIYSCYNIIVCLGLKLINLNCTLEALMVVNIVIIGVLLYKIIKDKKIQKYYVKLKDVVGIVIISFVALIVVYVNFGLPANISFAEVDISNHYKMTTDFYNTGEIELASISGAYINYGILFKVFFDPIEKFNGYYLFLTCEILKFIFSGILFYLVIKQFIKTKISYLITIVLSIIYIVAYPLNGFLCGFVYFQMAINIVGAILIVMVNYNKLENKIKNILLFFLTFGLMFTYYILVPPVYIAIFLYELKGFKNNKKEKILNEIKIFLIPCISGILYFIMPSLIDSQNNFNPATGMSGELADQGYIFVSYFAMFLYFIPFNIYHIIDNIKKKKIDFLTIVLLANVFYIIIVLILKQFGIVARYYAMKPYYMLWLIMLQITGVVICNILSKNIQILYKILTIIVGSFYVLGLLFSVFVLGSCDFKIFEKEQESIYSMYNIFRLNRGIILKETFETIYTNEELNLLKQFFKDKDDYSNIVLLEDGLNGEWIRKIILNENFKYKDAYIIAKQFDEAKDYILNSKEKIYVICYKNFFLEYSFSPFLDEINDKLEIVASQGKLVIYTNKDN